MSDDFIIEMEEFDWNDMYPERPVDYEGMEEVLRYYYDLDEIRATLTPNTPIKLMSSPPPPPLKGPRPYSYDDLDLLPAKRRLLFV